MASKDDYGTLIVKIVPPEPNKSYILEVLNEAKGVVNTLIVTRDTTVRFANYKAAKYWLRISYDTNKNGKWDTGDLFETRQAENVIPYTDVLQVKAGWDNTIDFEKLEKGKKSKAANSPGKREQTPDK